MGVRRRGFTLIELLVVIAIIAILAAILFPLLSRAREQGRISACASNLHQIFGALSMYCDNYGGFLPDCKPINDPMYKVRDSMDQDPDPRQIHSLLLPYASNKKELFRCPGDSIVPRTNSAPGQPGVFDRNDLSYRLCTYPKYGSSYQWRLGYDDGNGCNSEPDNPNRRTQNPISGKALSSFLQPSQLGAARDAQGWHLYARTHDRADWKDAQMAGNVLFLDGHVKFTHGTEFLAGIY